MTDARSTAVVGSACSCVLEASSDREDRSLDVCCVGDTRQSVSAKNDDSIPHTHHLVQIVSHRNIKVSRPKQIHRSSKYRRGVCAARAHFFLVVCSMARICGFRNPLAHDKGTARCIFGGFWTTCALDFCRYFFSFFQNCVFLWAFIFVISIHFGFHTQESNITKRSLKFAHGQSLSLGTENVIDEENMSDDEDNEINQAEHGRAGRMKFTLKDQLIKRELRCCTQDFLKCQGV